MCFFIFFIGNGTNYNEMGSFKFFIHFLGERALRQNDESVGMNSYY